MCIYNTRDIGMRKHTFNYHNLYKTIRFNQDSIGTRHNAYN